MQIEITKQDVKKLEEIGQNEKKHYFQKVIAHFDNKRFPVELRIKLTSQQQPYSEGNYTIDDSCWSISRFDYLEYNPYNIKLVLVK